jgi:AGZA family xanthine/uracil permease-like MFS transporter
MRERLIRYFEVDVRGSTLRTEILAGCSTFLALSYIFIVNPAILAQAGVPKSAALLATIVASSLATMAMGLWARLPFVLAPGMEMNAYLAFYAVGVLGFNWREALGAVFWSGLIFVAVTLTHARARIIDTIPDRMKSGLALSVGMFLILIALNITGVIKYEGLIFKGIGQISGSTMAVLIVGTISVFILDRLRIPGAVLLSIGIASAVCHLLNVQDVQLNGRALSSAQEARAIGRLDLSCVFRPQMLPVILVLFLVDFFGSVAKLIGLSMKTTILAHGAVPRMSKALTIDGVATTVGGILGTSNLTVFVESGVGIAAGGRTGITAVTCALLMGLCWVAAPILGYVPLAATAGALIFVGAKLFPSKAELRDFSSVDVVATIGMQCAVLASFALDRAMLVGFGVYLVQTMFRRERLNPFMVSSFLALSIGVILQALR